MNDKNLQGLGGWLVLVGIGIVVSPIRQLAIYIPVFKPILEDGTWEALTIVGSDAYHPLWAPVLMFEVASVSLLVLAATYLIYLFFSKHYLFPRVFVAIFIASLVIIPLDSWLVTLILSDQQVFDPDTKKEFSRTLLSCLVWVPYMYLSKRVKSTFVEGRPSGENNPG